MAKSRAVYIFALLSAVVFVFTLDHRITIVTLIAVVALPVASFLLLCVNFALFKYDVKVNKFLFTKHEQAEIEIKYAGYIERERINAKKIERLEYVSIPAGFDFRKLNSLSIEARIKLMRIKPLTIGQASRIPGVTPADINILLIYFGR